MTAHVSHTHGCCAGFASPASQDGFLTSGVTASAASAVDLGSSGRPRTLLAARANSQPLLGAQTLQHPAGSDTGTSVSWLGPQVSDSTKQQVSRVGLGGGWVKV